MILAGDVGGTKTELALFEDVRSRKILAKKRFSSQEYPDFKEIVTEFLREFEKVPEKACFGVAGPVEDGICKATNLPWIIHAKNLSDSLGIPSVFLINDLEANARGISCLSEEELHVLSPGEIGRKGNRAIISAGTGLGEAGLYFDGKGYLPIASEGGHCNFAPCNEEEVEIWRYLSKKYGHVSYERILSGTGLVNVYRFYIEEKGEKQHPDFPKPEKERDLPKYIYEFSVSGKCGVCKKAVDRFISIYGSEAGNVALRFLALGGLYIGGGIAPKMLDAFRSGTFLEAFRRKGRFSDLLASIRVQIILNPETALLGAGIRASEG